MRHSERALSPVLGVRERFLFSHHRTGETEPQVSRARLILPSGVIREAPSKNEYTRIEDKGGSK